MRGIILDSCRILSRHFQEQIEFESFDTRVSIWDPFFPEERRRAAPHPRRGRRRPRLREGPHARRAHGERPRAVPNFAPGRQNEHSIIQHSGNNLATLSTLKHSRNMINNFDAFSRII